MAANKIKNHWIAILISIVLSLLMVWPFFYFQTTLGDDDSGILNQIIDDEIFYMARIKDVIDGHSTLGNAYLAEYKNQLPQQLFLSELLLAQLPKFFNLDMVQARILYNFILPAFAFILTYTAFYLIYPSRFWANFFSVLLIFGFYLFKFTRPVIPQFVFLFWITQFIFLWHLIKNSQNNKFLVLNIFNFGLLFYLYPFYWTFYLLFLVVLSFLYFFKDRVLSKQYFKILTGGLIVGFIYFYLTFLASRLPEYQETLTRLQLVFSHSPSEIKSVILSFGSLIFIGVLYWFKKIKMSKEMVFFIAGSISVLTITNQNIITGQKFEFGHYRMLAVFFLVFMVYYLFNNFKISLDLSLGRRLNFKFKFLVAGLMVVVSIFSTFSYLKRVTVISQEDIYRQKYSPVFKWLNDNAILDSVVYANEEISSLIPVYTANNVFYSRYANLFIISDREVEKRFILSNFFEKLNPDFVASNERAIWGVRYVDRYGDAVQANKWRKILGVKLKDETRLPEEEINRILAKAGQIQSRSFEEGLKDFMIDYFVWDKNKDSNWRLDNQRFLESVFENRDFVIYKAK